MHCGASMHASTGILPRYPGGSVPFGTAADGTAGLRCWPREARHCLPSHLAARLSR